MFVFSDRAKRLALLALSFSPVFLFAREINPDEAEAAAQNWLRRSPEPLGTRIVPLSAARPEVRAAAYASGRQALLHGFRRKRDRHHVDR